MTIVKPQVKPQYANCRNKKRSNILYRVLLWWPQQSALLLLVSNAMLD